MTNKRKIIYALIIVMGLALIITAVLIEQTKDEPEASVEVTTFQECLDAGYPALEIYPRQCQTPDGKTFIDESDQPSKTCQDLCGDNTCQEVTCQAIGCPCSETQESCPQDCNK